MAAAAVHVQNQGVEISIAARHGPTTSPYSVTVVFVMGADAAVGLESWREPERVVELAGLAVARRAGVSDADVVETMRSLGCEGRATMLEMPQFGVSSSAVRERAKQGRPLRYLVPDAVAAFIEQEGIYR